MNSSDQNRPPPLWAFFVTDFALLAAAWFIADRSAQPLSTAAMLGIIACVLAGAIVALVPLVMHVERQKNDALDERQRELEALARTVSTSAEQISIATAGLHEITELTQKNLRHADQLPHRLQEKIAEFQAQLANANEAEREELEKELAALRSSETERLESACDKVARLAAELGRLEAATRQHLGAANESLQKLALGTANAIGKAQAAAEQALAHARVEAARHVGETAGAAGRDLESGKAAALAAIDRRLAEAGAVLAEQLAREARRLAAARPQPEAAANAPGDAGGPSQPPVPAEHVSTSPPPADPGSAAAATAPIAAAAATGPAAAPATPAGTDAAAERIRKPRREDVSTKNASAPAAAPPDTTAAGAKPQAAPGGIRTHAVEERNRTPSTANGTAPAPETPALSGRSERPVGEAVAEPPAPAAPRRRPPKSAPAHAEPILDLGMEDALPRSGVIERVLSSDGATRLLVTAYIGIGNRLFLRGEGAGLSWEKGVPLQFVSIGKWRWETNDAVQPIRFKLLKNDEQECTGLGAQTLEPGHQQEVTAAF